MNTLFHKLWCVILSLAILINLLPASALAAEIPMEQTVVQHWVEDPPEEESEIRGPVEILSEDISKRGEYYKEFVLSNGLRMASLYAEPVHYSEDGQWKEIDNTLKLSSGAYTNTAGQWKVSFPQQLTKDKAVTITKDGYTLSFFMAGELYRDHASLTRASLGTAIQEQPVQLQSFQSATAQVQAVNQPELREETQYPQAPANKSYARLQYTNVSSGTDIVYDLKGNQVKESIIMDAYSARLQGYRYTLNVGDLNPVLTDSGEINLYDRDNKQIVMVMPAPFLLDGAGEYCYDVEVNLTGTGSQYTLTYQLPQQWLADSERQWPVVLDPVVNASIANNNIKDVSVYENNPPNDHTSGVMDVGHNTTYGVMRAFLKYDNLPALSSSDIIVNASLRLYKPNDHSTTNAVEVHKVTSTWSEIGMTWSNQPGYHPIVEDYAIVKDHGYYFWEITDVVRGWYEGQNTGLMLKAPNWVETTTSTSSYRKQFYSSDYYATSAAHSPALAIVFRNNNGLEGYWDYTSSSAGRAGTGYINDYTGNLVWVHSDIGFGGNRMPVSIDHIYNANDSASNTFGLGYGWRTNYNQRAYKCTLANLAKQYYVWEDADGTDHYFYYDEDDKKYVDEDGLELTLTLKNGLPEKITDKEGNTYYFDTQGRLTQLENNQKTRSRIQITYTTTTGYLISTITDGAGRKYQFTYSGNLLDKINYTGSGTSQIGYVTYTYSNSCPTKITYQDSTENSPKYSQFTYSSKRLLLTAQDIDGYKLTYTYTTQGTGKPSRVKTVTENHNGKTGSTLTLTYAHNQTTFTDNLGNVQIKQFNNLGNTISVQDDEGRAQFTNYARNNQDDPGKANQLLLSSKLQNTVGNMLNNSSFEGTTVWGDVRATASLCTTTAYLGSKSIQFSKDPAETTGYVMTPAYTAEPGETYTFSAYVKTGANASAYLSIGTTRYNRSEVLLDNQGWTRLQVSYTNTGATSETMYAKVLSDEEGTVYVDCVQLEKAETASRYNIIENGDFRFGSNAWIMSDYCDSDEKVVTAPKSAAHELNTSAFQIMGDPSHKLRIRQEVPVSGVKGDTFVLAGWAMGEGVPLSEFTDDKRQFTLRGSFLYTDGTSKVCEFEFNPDTGGTDVWQYAAGVMVAEKAFSGIKIQVLYDYGANTIYFDGIQLYKEEFGNSYTYDDDGNVISVKDLQGKTTQYEYTNNNLTEMTLPTGAKLTYEYDSFHNVKKATTAEGLIYEFEYDEDGYGNNTKVSIINGTQKITSTATYSTDGNRLVSTTDALEQTTTYSYHPDTNVLEWVQYPEDTPETRTKYTYDAMYRTAKAALETDTGLNLSAEYTYENDLLTAIKTASTTYSFTYGNFAQRSRIDIGDRNLARYSYQEGTNWLEKLDYGNEDYVEYIYDNHGRVTKQTYEDDSYVTYHYDNNGALARVYDSQTDTTSTYYYDFTDRMMKYVEKSGTGTHTVGYAYDSINNLTKLVETIGDEKRETSYTYDEDNRPTAVTADGGSRHYTYDHYGRVATLTTKHGNHTVTVQTYTYKTNTNGTPTNQISAMTVSDGNGNQRYAYTYTYDQKGNITGISDGTYTTNYTYDSANQLIREDNEQANTTTVWTYDDAGNILTRTVYLYTTEAVDTGTQTNYGYSNTQWGDLLTAYNNKPIVRDKIGNPTNDFTWYFSWQHGRQLASMTRLGTSGGWWFTYNADGMRTQRTNGTTTYNYTYLDGQLTHMTVDGHTMYFSYDASGMPLSLTYDGTNYYYVTNLQGDVVAILNSSGAEIVTYAYDAWGNLITADIPEDTLGFYNPLRYRGYVYDTETGLYYVSSRYYDSEIGRFINADTTDILTATPMGLTDKNLFAYCDNNPVMRADHGGDFWHIVVGAAVGALIGGVVKAVSNAIEGKSLTDGLSTAMLAGAASGALASTGVGIVGMVAGNAAISMAENAANQVIENKGFNNFDVGDMLIDGAIGGVSGALGGAGKGTKHLTNLGKQTVKRTFNATTNKGLRAGLKEAGKAFAYYGKNSAKYYKTFVKGLSSDFISTVGTTIASSNYMKYQYCRIFGR